MHLLPFIMFLVAFNVVNGQLMGRTGYYYPWYIAGAALELIGGVLVCMPPNISSILSRALGLTRGRHY